MIDARLVPRSRRASFTSPDHNYRGVAHAPDGGVAGGTKTGELLNRRLFANQNETHFSLANNMRHAQQRGRTAGVPDVVVDRTRENVSRVLLVPCLFT